MNRAILCLSLTVLFLPACRKHKPAGPSVPAPEPAPGASAGEGKPGAVNRDAGLTSNPQTVPTLKGIPANSDHPMARALSGNDPQAHLRALNELLMVWDQSQGKPLTSPDDLVKAGFLSRLPNPPLGMKFAYNPNKRAFELVPAR